MMLLGSNRRRHVPEWTMQFLVAVAALHLVSSFQLVPGGIQSRPFPSLVKNNCVPPPSRLSIVTQRRRSQRKQQLCRTVVRWASLQDDEDEEEETTDQDASFDGLYEIRNRRQGAADGDVDRRRKRDRIKEWIAGSNTSRKPSALVQPIRMEDGTVVEPDIPRVQSRFDKLFAGMPTLEEILSKGESAAAEMPLPIREIPVVPRSRNDYSWFEGERKELEDKYKKILEDMKAQIDEQRREDPENVPANAEGVVEAIIRKEMERTIDSVRTARAKERLQDYEIGRMSELSAANFEGATDEVVERILKETAEDWKRRDTLQAEVDDFVQYEKNAFTSSASYSESGIGPAANSDLDAWALERLEEMLSKSQKLKDEDGTISDILEQNIDDLRTRIEKESKKGKIQPQTMKEWQMYRAIATRLNKLAGLEGAEIDFNDDKVAARLESWKQYVGQEEESRKSSGLAIGPRMPFEWQEAGRDPLQSLEKAKPLDKRRQREIRREVNMQAIAAMEELVKRTDSVRAESLKKGLAALKAELEPRDFNDVEEEDLEETSNFGPVDISDIFKRREDKEKDVKSPSLLANPSAVTGGDVEDKKPLVAPKTPFFSEPEEKPRNAPPNTAFFSDTLEDEESPKPPKTPFFDEGEESKDVPDVSTSSKLGSGGEQKLRSMYARAGARTTEEQNSIREQWEDFQKLEKEKRSQSGLSGEGDDSALLDNVNVKYNLSDVMKGDGDFDADKILSAIGPRPVRKKSGGASGGSSTASVGSQRAENQPQTDSPSIDSSEGGYPTESTLEPSEITNSLYRSIAAVGGGRTKDDPSAKAKEKAEFEEYLRKEEEMRRSLDSIDEDATERAAAVGTNIDDVSYAKNALDSMGPRPIFKRKRKEILDEAEYSDMGGALASEDGQDDITSDDSLQQADLVPDWLKEEREESRKRDGHPKPDVSSLFLGSDIDEVFDDDKYDHNMRQLAEYERRRAGEKGQTGINIRDVLGRRGSDDYADYTYDSDYFRAQSGGWGAASFQARKASLLDYTELSAMELNNLMDHKDSVYSTGVSQYLPRINKPFKDFGAVFRLEGVMVDLSGLQLRAWTMIADEFGFKKPLLEDVHLAAVTRPEIAIRSIFYWSDDIIVCRDVVSAHRRIVRALLDDWATEMGLTPPSSRVMTEPVTGSMALGEDIVSQNDKPVSSSPLNEAAKIDLIVTAWSQTAQALGYRSPSKEEVIQSSVLSPDIAVRDGFRWSSDLIEIDRIVTTYARTLRALTGDDDVGSGVDQVLTTQQAASRPTDENTMLELQFAAWKKVAEENSLLSPTPEEVVAASVLNDPEAVIRIGFGWTDDHGRSRDLARRYLDLLAESVNSRFHGRSFEGSARAPEAAKEGANESKESREPDAPTKEEILAMQIQAWKTAAATHAFAPPSSEQVELTISMGANEAVRRLLAWTYNFNDTQINTISATYEAALRSASQDFIQKYSLNVPEEALAANMTPDKEQATGVNDDELFQAAYDAWTHVAWSSGLALPNKDGVMFALSVGPEEAIMNGFGWTNKTDAAKVIAEAYREQIKIKREQWQREGKLDGPSAAAVQVDEDIPFVKVLPGSVSWIKSLREVEMGCGVLSNLDHDQMDMILEYAGLRNLFPQDERVSATNRYDRDSQQMLGVALRIERRPDHCVMFDTSPFATTAAHEVDMRSVALVGPYPRYELLTADTSASSFDELTAMNIRRLFGERVSDQPMMDTQEILPEIKRKTLTKTRFWDDE